MTTPESPIIVIGGGAMGLATGWALAREGHRPIVLERFEQGHTNGASHGATRNFNDAYDSDVYLRLLTQAETLWHELERESGQPLLQLHGLVTHGDDAIVAAVAAAHARFGRSSTVLSAADAHNRWPGMRFATTALFSPGAGVVRAADALVALERGIRAHGGEVRWSSPVTRVDEETDGVRVELADGSALVAPTVVITAGAWARDLVPASIGLPALRITEETPAHFAPVDPSLPWPSFNHQLPGAGLLGSGLPGSVYGMPTPDEGVKVGFHAVGNVVDPDDRPHLPTWQQELRDYVREWFPGLDPESAQPISCTYTSTPDSAFVLDRIGRIVVGAGFSGHGFKFTPAIGQTLARLATDPDATADPLFRATR